MPDIAPASSDNASRFARWSDPRCVLGLLALWLLATLGARPLLLPDEGRYAGVARDMLRGGDGLTPLLNGLPFFHKPPLMYWLDMAAMAVGGVNQFSARFAPFVGAWVMAAATFLAVRRWHGPRAAAAALLMLAACPFFFVGSQYANADMLVGGLVTAAVFAFVRALDDGALRWIVAAWCLAALSVLAKGLIGVVLPMLVVGPWLFAQRRWRDAARLLHPLGLLAFALVGLPWFVATQWRYPGFFDYFVVEQHFRRFADNDFNNHHPLWFFALVLPLLTLPISLWAPAAARDVWRALRGPGRARLALYVWWIACVVGFFSLPSSKLVGYVLPALAPWCMLLSLAALRHERALRRTVALSAVVSLLAVGALARWAPHSSKPAAQALAARMAPGDRVVFVDDMFYDLPFYAGLQQPPIIASDWASPELPKHDNWRKELYDAARFDPARGRELLRPLDRLDELTCHAQAVWFVMAPAAAAHVAAALPTAQTLYADREALLLRVPGRRC